MQAQVQLGRVFGIRIGLHYSWFLIAILIVFSLSGQFATVHRDWSPGVVWGTAILTALLFFICIVLHELGHSVVAQSRGIRVPSIVLFALGGVSQMERESPDAKTEFWMALAGPLVSSVSDRRTLWGGRDQRRLRLRPWSRCWAGSHTSISCWGRSTSSRRTRST